MTSSYIKPEDNLLQEIDKFLEESDSESDTDKTVKVKEIPEKCNNESNDKCKERSEVDLNDSNTASSVNFKVANNITSLEPSEIQYIGKNQAVFELLEDNEECGLYEHNPYECNWNVFYKTLSPEKQKLILKQEPKTEPEPEPEPEIVDDYTVNSENELSNFTFCLEKNLNDENETLSCPSVNFSHVAAHNNVFYGMHENLSYENETISHPSAKLEYAAVQDHNFIGTRENSNTLSYPRLDHEEVNEHDLISFHENSSNENKTLSYPSANLDHAAVQDHNFIGTCENSNNEKETTLSYPSTNFNHTAVQDHDFVGLCEKKIDINQNVSIPNITTEYHIVHDQDDRYGYYNAYQDSATSIKNRKQKPFYKQSRPFYSENTPLYYKRNHHVHNNFNQSNNWKQKKSNSFYSSSTSYEKNSFNQMYNNEQTNGFTNSKFIPERHANTFTTQPNKTLGQHFNNMNHHAQDNRFGHRTPFTKNNLTSSNPQFSSENIDKPTLNNFKRPLLPPITPSTQSHCSTEHFKNPQHSLKQPDLNQRNHFHKDTTRQESIPSFDFKITDSQPLAINSTLFYGSKNKYLPNTDKIIDKLPTKRNENKDDDKLTRKVNTYDNIDYSVESGIQFKQHYIAKDVKNCLPNTNKIIDKSPAKIKEIKDDDKSTEQKINTYDVNNLVKSDIQIKLHYIVVDYLSPVSLVGSTVKFVSRKLANTNIREKLLKALSSHGVIEHTWWTPDDMFYISYADRTHAKQVFSSYPKNMTSSY